METTRHRKREREAQEKGGIREWEKRINSQIAKGKEEPGTTSPELTGRWPWAS
jgi:hypothetical protein